ncbi:amino acid ABC transporter permease [Aeromicrobium sp. CTD01-1L150]|uniref:amino acid ABC transporter permease n=1 Tax=Aeromicrobium sp. CTD01-1L150 TaxID=3341830 RepID=UPI0035BFF584
MTFYYGDILPYLPLMLEALWLSVWVTLASFAVGCVLGVGLSAAKVSSSRFLRVPASAYIELVRNTPLLVQLYLIYFGIGQLGFSVSPLWSALIGLTLNNAAYTAEIFRAGFASVPAGLREAGAALALSRWHQFRHVVLVPGLRGIIPSLTNQLIILFLYSSVASVISLEELTAVLLNINSDTLRTLEVFTYGAVLYWGTSALIAYGSRTIEKVMFRW